MITDPFFFLLFFFFPLFFRILAMTEDDRPTGDTRNIPYNSSKLFYLYHCPFPVLTQPNPIRNNSQPHGHHQISTGARCTATPRGKVARDANDRSVTLIFFPTHHH